MKYISAKVLSLPWGKRWNKDTWRAQYKQRGSSPGFGDRLSWSAGPSTPKNIGALAMLREDAISLVESFIPSELPHLDVFFVPAVKYLNFCGSYVEAESKGCFPFFLRQITGEGPLPHYPCGRMALKMEPAGKTRVFMIVDSIYQRLLVPLHEWVFDVLRLIPTDGTFNQLSPVLRLLKRRILCSYSFDLKAATDRIPAGVCCALLYRLWGGDVAEAWHGLMCRLFSVPKRLKLVPHINECIMFVTGTPLGSLSASGRFCLVPSLSGPASCV